jgi:N-acetylmuramoyl-L-alanine amidase
MEYQYFNSGDRQASAHMFIDANKAIQTIPFNEISWHAGTTANHSMIGIELCTAIDQYNFNKIYNNAVEIVASIFVNTLNIKQVNTVNLMSHAEVSMKWGETDHQDPIAYFAKFCKTFAQFRSDVQLKINSMQKGGNIMNVQDAIKKLVEKGVISSPGYWNKAIEVVKYLDQLLINMANKL